MISKLKYQLQSSYTPDLSHHLIVPALHSTSVAITLRANQEVCDTPQALTITALS